MLTWQPPDYLGEKFCSCWANIGFISGAAGIACKKLNGKNHLSKYILAIYNLYL
jgi:hypothetical protein